MNKLVYLIIISALCSGCGYHKFTEINSPGLISAPAIPPALHDALLDRINKCTINLNDARKSAYNANKKVYDAYIFGSSFTLITGTSAGAFGAAAQTALSAVSGGLSFVAGVVTIYLVDRTDTQSGEENQTKMITAWSNARTNIEAYEKEIVSQTNHDDHVSQRKLDESFARLNESFTQCGVAVVEPQLHFTVSAL